MNRLDLTTDQIYNIYDGDDNVIKTRKLALTLRSFREKFDILKGLAIGNVVIISLIFLLIVIQMIRDEESIAVKCLKRTEGKIRYHHGL